jgi:exonuclease III
MKILTWNINHRTQPKKIPPQMAEALASLEPDTIVLTEYVKGPAHDQFLHDLKAKGYAHPALSPEKKRQNSILIVSRTPLKPGTVTGPENIIEAVPCNVLHVVENSGVHVLAVRMPLPMTAALKKDWWDWVTRVAEENRHLPFIITGDFNTDPEVTKGPNGKVRFANLRKNGWLFDLPATPSWWNTHEGGSKLDHTLLSASHFGNPHSVYLTGSGPYVFARKAGAMSDHAVLLVDAMMKTDVDA